MILTLQRLARSKCACGFTLLELVVALAIFALLGAIAYGGLQSVLVAQEQSSRATKRLGALQSAWNLMQRDIEQTVARSVRDNSGSTESSLAGGRSYEYALILTRGGRKNPLHQRRSSLQRIAYRLVNGNLVRTTWSVLDRAPDSTPDRDIILEHVQSFSLRFLDARREWQETWPRLGADGGVDASRPLAIKVTLQLQYWGELVRVFAVAGG